MKSALRTALAAAAITLTVAIGAAAAPANAVENPSWSDVEKAKANTADAQAQVDSLEASIGQLNDDIKNAQKVADSAAADLDEAQQKLDAATERADDLSERAGKAQAEAKHASKIAGQMAAQMYRSGNVGDQQVQMFLSDESKSKDMLSRLARMSKVTSSTATVYEAAEVASNTSESLSGQADAAESAREKLREEAEAKLDDAKDAQQEADAALAAQQVKIVEMEAKVAFLRNQEAATAAAYRSAIITPSRVGGSYTAGAVGPSGWARPAAGGITDVYGPRAVICSSGGCSGGTHYGTDIGASCNSPIYAAATGTVVWAGRLGTYGNFVKISHGDFETGYAHIVDGGIQVADGQQVTAGQVIALVGSTGASTGCHLHFEVFQDGSRIDAQPFMSARGVNLY